MICQVLIPRLGEIPKVKSLVHAHLAGEELTIEYTSGLQGTASRRRGLVDNWLFNCGCARCLDPTELGSFLSALRCFKCRQDFLLCHFDALEWVCRGCGYKIGDNEATELIEGIQEKVSRLSIFGPIDQWEGLLSEMESLIHPDHSLAMDVKRILIQVLGGHPDYPLHSLGDDALARKISLCQNYLQVYDKASKENSAG